MGSFDVSLHPDCRTLQCGSGCLSLFKFAPPTKANWPGRIRRGCQLPDTPCPGIIARGWFRSLLGSWNMDGVADGGEGRKPERSGERETFALVVVGGSSGEHWTVHLEMHSTALPPLSGMSCILA